MARRTKDEAEKTRDAILDAAEDLFHDRGVTRTSLEQIARAVGVTRGAVYWHFKDKSELFDAIMHRVFLPHEDMLEELAIGETSCPIKELVSSAVNALKKIARDTRRQRVITIIMVKCEYVDEMADVMLRRTACEKRMLSLSEKVFTRARSLGQLSPLWSPRNAATAFQAMISGLIVSALERQAYSELGKTASACLSAFAASLQKID